MNKLLRVGITHGNINSDNYALLGQLFASPELLELCTPVVFGSLLKANQYNKSAGNDALQWYPVNNAHQVAEGRLNLVECCHVETLPCDEETANRCEQDALFAAREAYDRGDIDVIVTLPGTFANRWDVPELIVLLSKPGEEQLNDQPVIAGWRIHEQSIFHPYQYQVDEVSKLSASLSIIHRSLRADFGHLRPRIAVVAPTDFNLDRKAFHEALLPLRESGVLAFGPFSEEQFLGDGMMRHYDAIVSLGDASHGEDFLTDADRSDLYSYSVGLPMVHTAPYLPQERLDEAVASTRLAIYNAIDIYRARRRYAAATHAPLEKQWIPRGRDDFKLDLSKSEDEE